MERVDHLIHKYAETVMEHYHWLHAHPEVSGEEKESAAYIAAALRKMGLEPVENVGGYGVTAVIEGKGPGKCIGLRADFDALPIQEETGLPFASQNPGVMHACGHDSHAAMLLGAAYVLCEMKNEFNGKVKLLFQPSEEKSSDSGAKRMIADGALENPHVDAVIGQHVGCGNPVGTVASRPGLMSAFSDSFTITIEGKACHASAPHNGVDALLVGAQIVTALQSIVARNVAPLKCAVLTIGKMTAGDRYNVLAGRCEIAGTCRNHDPAVRDMMEKRMEAIACGIAEGMGATCKFNYIRGYSPLNNNEDMYDLLKETAGELLGTENVKLIQNASLGGEDFSFFEREVPGVFFHTGCKWQDRENAPAHNGKFCPNPEGFFTGGRVMITTALKYLAQN